MHIYVFVSTVYGDCPSRDELHCYMYDTKGCPEGSVKNTVIEVGDISCDACRMCIKGSGKRKSDVCIENLFNIPFTFV